MHSDALRHHSGQSFRKLREIHIVFQLEIHQLALAADADAERQQDGYLRVWIEALGIFEGVFRAQEGSLHRAHEIQMAEPDCAPGLAEAHSQFFRHHSSPLPS